MFPSGYIYFAQTLVLSRDVTYQWPASLEMTNLLCMMRKLTVPKSGACPNHTDRIRWNLIYKRM